MIWHFSAGFLIRIRACAAVAGVMVWASLIQAPAWGITIVDMDFNGPTGLENDGIGPNGVLKGGASISGGQLVLNGSNAAEPTGAGLDLDIGGLSTFSGAADFSIEFDFASINGGVGALFSADGAKFLDDTGGEFPGGQEGSINIYSEGSQIVADLWFIGAVEIPGTFNDNLFHHVSVFYSAAQGRLEMSVDGVEGDPLIVEDGAGFLRDTSHDITRLGDENNPDFGAEFNNGCMCKFDNLLIEGPTPPPVKLIVNRLTGAVTLEAIAEDPVNINSISIFSDAGALESANYDEIDGANPTFDSNDVWQIDVLSDTEISQSDGPGGANDGATLTSGQTFSLGTDVWQPFFDEDVEIFVFDTAPGEDVRGSVEYIGGSEALFGDLDVDGDIDVQDYVVFQAGFDENVEGLSFFDAYFLADLNGDETHNFEDFIAFADAYDVANGAGAFVAMVAGVPEPTCMALVVLGAVGLFAGRFRLRLPKVAPSSLLLAVGLCLLSGSSASAAELVEYLFTTNFNDTSGNNRHGVPNTGVFGGTPTVSGGKLNLHGDLEEGVIVPLGAANPFGGLTDYTIELTFNSTGSSAFPDAGVILLGSANPSDPTSGDNQSLSVYVDPQAEGGSLVVDYFFVDEVRVPDAMLLDGMDHSIKITYVAPDDPGPPEDPTPGSMFLNIDGEWLAGSELNPRPPSIASHQVRIGGTLNTDFPFQCEEAACFTSEFEGTIDDFRVFDEEMAPSLLRAEVDLSTGEITLLGGEFGRDLRYYEITSAAGALNPAGWNSLEEQSIDDIGAGPGQHWDELSASSSQLAEAFLLGSSSFDELREISLGNAFAVGAARDLELIAVTSDLASIPLEILYVNAPPAVAGDYNGNGRVDAADYTIWQDSFGQTGAGLAADGDGNMVVNQADYTFWKTRFGNTSGAGVGSNSAVPEPTTWALALVAGCVFAWVTRRS